MLARNKIALIVVGTGIAVVSAYVIGTSDAVVSRILSGGLATYVRAPCRFEGAHFNFLEGIDVRGLVILDPADPFGEPLLAAERCRVNYTLDVTGFGPHVTGIDIEKPRLRVERTADGSFPIERVLTVPAPQGAAPPRFPLRFSGATVSFADPSIVAGEPLTLRDLSVTVTPGTSKSANWAGAVAEATAASDVLGALSLRAVVDPCSCGGMVVLASFNVLTGG